jgi:PKD repeat protein
MKKFITLLALVLTAFTHSSFAQPGTVCNADFNFTVSGNSVQFTPAIINTSAMLQHHWLFGDGTPGINLAAPLHVYPGTGVYTIKHFVKYLSPNDSTIIVCADSTTRLVTIVGLPTCTIHSNFGFVRDSVQTNKVYFTNLSTGTTPNTIVRWSFGDGTYSYDNNPTHIYTSSGHFTVCLYVKRDSLCLDDTCNTVEALVPTNTCNLVAGFDSHPDSLNPLTIHFTNHSLPFDPTDSIRYTFGDGSSSNDLNPSHTYTAAGVYTVCIRVKKITQSGSVPCVREFCRVITVPAPVCNLAANFNSHPDSANSRTIHFTNLSTPLNTTDSVRWTFGDGSSSNDLNPSHTYTSSATTFTVCLRIKKITQPGAVPCVSEFCNVIAIHPSCNLVAYFAIHPDSINPRTVHFTNLSTALASTDSIRWTFGDGSSSADINPSHTYTAAGSYTVCLRVKKITQPGMPLCVNEYCKTVVIPQQPDPCTFEPHFTFYSDTTTGGSPNTYHFSNTTAPLNSNDSSFWDLGDGTPLVINPNDPFTHTYPAPGIYVVCLRVKKISNNPIPDFCIRQVCQAIVIPAPCNLTPDFFYYFDTVNQAPRYHFTNGSQPLSSIDSSVWNFGDGSFSHDSNPQHIFPAPGIYIVCLTVKKHITGSVLVCERQICKTVIVPSLLPVACNLLADFSNRNDSINHRKIFFTNFSNAQPSQAIATWTFGDGTGTAGTSWNADHIYAQPGQYTVCLKVALNNTCIKDTCKMITVLASAQDSCNIQVGFTSRIDSVNRRKVYFINTTTPLNTAVINTWSFGDGTAGTGWNADHIYVQPGRYAVCLTVTKGNNCTRVWCDSVFIPGSTVPPVNCDSISLGYVYRRDAYMPNKLFFFATSNRPVMQQSWTFTLLPNGMSITVNQNDLVHVFGDTGTYWVCLKGVLLGGCIKEYCDVVSISSTATPSQCILLPYPNPAHNQVSVNLQLQQPELITASVYSIQNILLLQHTQQGFTGNNLVTINIQNLVPGYYTIRLVYGNQVCYARFQKF